MTCTCCDTGRCCNGASCSAASKSECAYQSGTFITGADCATYACTSAFPYDKPCTFSDGCACAFEGKILRPPATTCNCDTLTEAGVPYGGCQVYYCNECVNGVCSLTCIFPRTCCAGACCPESMRCNTSGGYCVNKCSDTTTYCNTTGSGAYSYTCCSATQKCCGASGCLPASVTKTVAVDVSVNGWVDTGFDVSGAITVTATGTVTWNPGKTVTPAGVPAGDCFNYSSCNAENFCHMALIGRIGTTGAAFLLGANYSGSPGNGRLYVRQNDVCVADNSGTYSVTISTPDPCPGYAGAAVGEPIVYAEGETPAAPGPGAALKSLLRVAGIVSSPTCSCNARAAQMDEWGEWESLKRIPEICGWLKEEADKRGMWFFRPAGYALVLVAVLLSALKRPFGGNNK